MDKVSDSLLTSQQIKSRKKILKCIIFKNPLKSIVTFKTKRFSNDHLLFFCHSFELNQKWMKLPSLAVLFHMKKIIV